MPDKIQNRRSFQDLGSVAISGSLLQSVRSLLSELCFHSDIEAIYLYGSYARSEQKPYSDLDIAVITQSSEPSRDLREYIGSFAGKKIDVQVFSDLPLPARMQVISEGIPLFIRNPDFIRELRHAVVISYMDLEPMRKRWNKRILGAPHEVI